MEIKLYEEVPKSSQPVREGNKKTWNVYIHITDKFI